MTHHTVTQQGFELVVPFYRRCMQALGIISSSPYGKIGPQATKHKTKNGITSKMEIQITISYLVPAPTYNY